MRNARFQYTRQWALLGCGCLGLALTLVLPAGLQADEGTCYGNGFQVTLGPGFSFTNAGDLNTDQVLVSGSLNAVVDTPHPDQNGSGYFIRAGFKVSDWGIDLQYDQQVHPQKYSLLGQPLGSVTYSMFDLDGRYYFMQDAFQVSAIFGLAITSAAVTNAYLGTVPPAQTAYYGGLGFNLGVGAQYYLLPQLSLGCDYLIRFLSLDSVNNIRIDGGLNGGTLQTLLVGVQYCFSLD